MGVVKFEKAPMRKGCARTQQHVTEKQMQTFDIQVPSCVISMRSAVQQNLKANSRRRGGSSSEDAARRTPANLQKTPFKHMSASIEGVELPLAAIAVQPAQDQLQRTQRAGKHPPDEPKLLKIATPVARAFPCRNVAGHEKMGPAGSARHFTPSNPLWVPACISTVAYTRAVLSQRTQPFMRCASEAHPQPRTPQLQRL